MCAEPCLTYRPNSVISAYRYYLIQSLPLGCAFVFMNRGAETSAHVLVGELPLQWFAVFLTCITSTFHCLVIPMGKNYEIYFLY